MTDLPPPPTPRPRRSWLLIVSLCLNIALIPVIGAVLVRALHRDVEIGSGGILAPRSLITAFPAEAGRIQKVIATHTPKIKALRHESFLTRLAAWQLLNSPAYSPASMATALDTVHAADTALEAESIAMLNDSVATLTPQERAALSDKVKRRNRSWLFRLFRPKFDG